MDPLIHGAAGPTTWVGTQRTIIGVVVAWMITILALVVLDDLVFGPAFWLLAGLEGPGIAFAFAFVVYLGAQLAIVRRGTAPHPGRLAAFFLARLGLERPVTRLAAKDRQLRSRVIGGSSAILLAPVLGGVVPPMLLWKRGFGTTFVRRISVATATLYAAEFALLHGWIPGIALA